MNIALFGSGKTGKLVEELIRQSGKHNVSFVITSTNREALHRINNQNTDAVIDFTNADAVMGNIHFCLEKNIPMVIGTTGWYERLNEVEEACINQHGSIVWAGNFSIGVNLFFEINKFAAGLLHRFDYAPRISETHHVHKLDAPSGTAKVLAQQTANAMHQSPEDIPIASERTGEVIGMHEIRYRSVDDVISISHEALSRRGFAAGALLAAEWIKDRRGFYNFANVFQQL